MLLAVIAVVAVASRVEGERLSRRDVLFVSTYCGGENFNASDVVEPLTPSFNSSQLLNVSTVFTDPSIRVSHES